MALVGVGATTVKPWFAAMSGRGGTLDICRNEVSVEVFVTSPPKLIRGAVCVNEGGTLTPLRY